MPPNTLNDDNEWNLNTGMAIDAWIDSIPDNKYDICKCGCGVKFKFILNPETHEQTYIAKHIAKHSQDTLPDRPGLDMRRD